MTQKWVDIVDALQANPGQWATLGVFSPGAATKIRRGKYPAFLRDMPEGFDPQEWVTANYEVTTRRTGDGDRSELYVRYVGVKRSRK